MASYDEILEQVAASTYLAPLISSQDSVLMLDKARSQLKAHVWLKQSKRDIGAMRGAAVAVALVATVAAVEDAQISIVTAIDRVADEVARARNMWPVLNSAHEGYAVLLEEIDEYRAAQTVEDRATEAIQVAAMAVAFAAEVCNEERGRR